MLYSIDTDDSVQWEDVIKKVPIFYQPRADMNLTLSSRAVGNIAFKSHPHIWAIEAQNYPWEGARLTYTHTRAVQFSKQHIPLVQTFLPMYGYLRCKQCSVGFTALLISVFDRQVFSLFLLTNEYKAVTHAVEILQMFVTTAASL